MSLRDKRQEYSVKNYVELKNIKSWNKYYLEKNEYLQKLCMLLYYFLLSFNS